MNAKTGLLLAFICSLVLILASCTAEQLIPERIEPTITAVRPALEKTSPPQRIVPVPSITGITWDPGNHVVNIGIDPWPESWSPWTVLIDGVEIPLEEENGAPIVRPNAPLDQPPTGLIVGTLPWVTGLEEVDFPCCGSLQFFVPEAGYTNSYDFNLKDFGCATASTKNCPSEWTVHEGDWIIGGTESIEIVDSKVIQKGNIYVRDSASLTIRSSELMMERGSTPTIHVYIFVEPKATLVIDKSLIYPGPDNGGLTCVFNYGSTSILDSPTSIHYFDMSGSAMLIMDNSEMIYEIGGLLQVTGGKTTVTDSTLGALGLRVPAGARLEASGLESGAHFDHWKVQDWIEDADYELSFENVTVLKDDFTGELEHGPYERGWIFFLDPNSHVRLSDSKVRKVFIDVLNDTASFRNLKIGEPSSLEYRDIILEDIVINGEWPFTIIDAEVTITDSDYLFLQPSGSSRIHLVNSHMVEFIPRSFSGTISFENGLWTNAGEIIGNVDYHSLSNDFTITGSLKISEDVQVNLQWKDARVTREFEVFLTDAAGNPIANGVIRIDQGKYTTDETGRAIFSIVFDESSYKKPVTLEAWYSAELIARQEINFFTQTPVRLHP